MLKLFKRWLAYFFIPAGIVLLFIPINTHRSVGMDKDFVFLKIAETLTEKITPSPIKETHQDNDIERLKAKLQELQTHVSEYDSQTPIVNPNGYPVVPMRDLDAYPVLKEKIKHMLQLLKLWRTSTLAPQQLTNLSIDQWTAFKNMFLKSSQEPAFQVENSIFKWEIKPSYATVPIEVKNLKIGCKIVGGVFLFLSIFLLRGIYGSSAEGIQVGKPKGIIIWDIVVALMGIMFMWWFLDFIFVKIFQTETAWGDEMCGFMGVFWVAFVIPFMGLITTATSLQTLAITKKEISLKGLFGKNVLSWNDVQDIQISEFFVPRKTRGIITPRKATKILLIKGTSCSLRIFEPPFASTKKKICSTLAEYAPEQLKETISNLTKEWVSLW